MTVSLYLAPAAGGKTAHCIALARDMARGLVITPRVVVPTRLQARAWRERLARAGGALGVRVGTFDDLYAEILRAAGIVVARLADPVQVRLLRTLIDTTPLTFYAPLRTSPGFVQVLRDLIGELKAGGVFPAALAEAILAMDNPPRLAELVRLYGAYQERLRSESWGDYAGIGWLAAEALENGAVTQAGSGALDALIVDGFDDFTSVQLAVLAQMVDRVSRLVVTLTGTTEGPRRSLVHRRFNRTRERLEEALGLSAEPLSAFDDGGGAAVPGVRIAPVLRHLEAHLYTQDVARPPAAEAVSLVAVPDREAEVRTALRWLKRRIVIGGMQPGEVALLARNLEPYRPFIGQVAEEFGVPVQMVDGLPLRSNPAVAALLELLHLAVPADGPDRTHLAWRPAVDAWRSPYFDWLHARTAGAIAAAAPAASVGDGPGAIGITPADADALDWVARWGSVLGGLEQWEEVFALLAARTGQGADRDEDSAPLPEALPEGEQADALRQRFRRFVARITPPAGQHTCREFVAWVEALIGDVALPDDGSPLVSDLGLARQAVSGPPALARRDEAALNALKDVLRGLVWAEEAVSCTPHDFPAFLDDLAGAVDGTTYRLPLADDETAILAANVIQARGVAFRAVAVMGLAEGEFPAAVTEDPFLRDEDRATLYARYDLPIDLSTDSAEAQIFYEAITRPSEALLITRPRIADNGTPWQPSPYWEEIRRRVIIEPQAFSGSVLPTSAAAASWTELLQVLAVAKAPAATGDGQAQVAPRDPWTWAGTHRPADCARIDRASAILSRRSQSGEDPSSTDAATSAFDGGLEAWAGVFADVYAPSHVWSASRLESYRTCPFFFFVSSVLGLEPRQAPAEGLDPRQLGNIYHHIFEQLYRQVGKGAALPALLDALPSVAATVLDAAPRDEQFRATAWWQRTREEIVGNVTRSLQALEREAEGGFGFFQAERTFGIPDEPGAALVVRDPTGDSFCLRGFIDRVDRDDRGGLRVIDYKTGGPSSFTNTAILEGKKLQLPLYALAARDALRLGDVVEGFYWHVQHAERSSFRLSAFRGPDGSGPRAAIACAVAAAWEAVHGARGGAFAPHVPDNGCPDYCAAAAFCWHYEPRGW